MGYPASFSGVTLGRSCLYWACHAEGIPTSIVEDSLGADADGARSYLSPKSSAGGVVLRIAVN